MIKKYLKKQLTLIASTTAALFLSTSILASTADARPGHRGGYFPLGPAQAILFGSVVYFVLDGIFHKEAPNGYVVAPAPIGARLPELPAAAVMVSINGKPYYTYSGVYYKKIPGGYLVVKAPNPPIIKEIIERQRLTVIVASLNVRSGPGMEYPALLQLEQGEVLAVEDIESDWSLVRLPDGSTGWVMSQYTAAISPEPKG